MKRLRNLIYLLGALALLPVSAHAVSWAISNSPLLHQEPVGKAQSANIGNESRGNATALRHQAKKRTPQIHRSTHLRNQERLVRNKRARKAKTLFYAPLEREELSPVDADLFRRAKTTRASIFESPYRPKNEIVCTGLDR